MASKKDFKLEFKNIIKQLEKQGDGYAEELKRQLTTLDKKATGQLIQSITSEVKVDGDKRFSIKVLSAPHLVFVDKGRRAGAKMPPIAPIEAWLKVRGIVANPFAVAKSIAKNGIKPTHVIDKTLTAINKNGNQGILGAIEGEVRRVLGIITKNIETQINKNKNLTARLRNR